MPAPQPYGRRPLPLIGFVVVTIIWLAIVKIAGAAAHHRADVHDGRLLTTHNVLWSLTIPVGAGLVFVYLVIAALGWWRPVFHDPRPTQRGPVPVHRRHVPAPARVE